MIDLNVKKISDFSGREDLMKHFLKLAQMEFFPPNDQENTQKKQKTNDQK